MPDRRGSVLILALIAVTVLAGRFLVDSTAEPERSLAATASGAPGIVAFELGTYLDRYRIEVASARLAAAEQRREARLEAKRRLERRYGDLPGSVSRSTLESIAACESGGDPRIVSSNGLYHGKYQFSVDTWASVGGRGMPSEAPEIEQDYRAALLYERSGPGQWPVCGS